MTFAALPCVAMCTLLLAICGEANAQKTNTSSPRAVQQTLSLNFKNNGERLTATVGQRIEITLGTVGSRQYGDAQVSSPAIQLESKALVEPINPGGPTFKYIFKAVAKGEAQIKVPIIYSDDPELTKRLTFTVVIRVRPSANML